MLDLKTKKGATWTADPSSVVIENKYIALISTIKQDGAMVRVVMLVRNQYTMLESLRFGVKVEMIHILVHPYHLRSGHICEH
jgi:hypothetical protein